VARIVKPHGLGGEVIVDLFTPLVERLAPGSVLDTDDGATLVVTSSRPHQGRHIVAFEGCVGRSAAEALRGRLLLAAPREVPGVLWVHELVGSRVLGTDGTELGRVVAVEANPASDLLVLDGGGLVPLHFLSAQREGELVVDVPPGLLDEG
jgi:16S rRNA processing protein RimM